MADIRDEAARLLKAEDWELSLAGHDVTRRIVRAYKERVEQLEAELASVTEERDVARAEYVREREMNQDVRALKDHAEDERDRLRARLRELAQSADAVDPPSGAGG